MLKLIGFLLCLSPFILLFKIMYDDLGIKDAIIIHLMIFGFLVIVTLGSYLIAL